MTCDEFWYGEPRLAVAYREAYELRNENERWREWRAGAYVFQALIDAAPALNAFIKGAEPKYAERPIFSNPQEDAEEAEMNRMKAQFEAIAAGINAGFASREEQS